MTITTDYDADARKLLIALARAAADLPGAQLNAHLHYLEEQVPIAATALRTARAAGKVEGSWRTWLLASLMWPADSPEREQCIKKAIKIEGVSWVDEVKVGVLGEPR